MLGIGKKDALKKLIERIDQEKVDGTIVEKTRINTRKDFENNNDYKIVLSHDVFFKLVKLYFKTYGSKTVEHGTLLYGKKCKDNVLYIDYSNLDLRVNPFDDSRIGLSHDNREELFINTKDKDYDVVIHFHTHPSYNATSKGIEDGNESSLRFTEQDLYTYGWFQQHDFPHNKNVLFLGMMSAVNHGKPTLDVVSYDTNEKKFYNIPQVYAQLEDRTIMVNKDDFLDINSFVINKVVDSTKKIEEHKKK